MDGIADKIMNRVSDQPSQRWVCTPKDFLDLGSRQAVDQALVAPRQGQTNCAESAMASTTSPGSVTY